MLHGMYSVKNVLSAIYSGIYLFPTDSMASVDLAVNLAPREYSVVDKQKFINSELQLYRVGSFDVETGKVVDMDSRLVPWDFRRFIETPMNVHLGTAQEQEIRFQQDVSEVR